MARLRSFKLRKGEPLLCACSGGADSLCLLWLLHESDFQVLALHCNHGLRKVSDLEEKQLRLFCEARGIRFVVYRSKLAPGAGLEERARRWRRRCMAKASKKFGIRKIFLAHHARDQAETLLLNLIRGTGAKGAMAMQARSPLEGSSAELFRPFLSLAPERLRSTLKAAGLNWSEDESNQDLRFRRNRIRMEILPRLEEILPGATAHLAAFSERLKYRGLPGLGSRALQHVEDLLAKGHGEANLPGGRRLQVSGGRMRLLEGSKIEGRIVPRNWTPEPNAFWFSDVILEREIRFRGARAGDRIRPFGMKGSRLIFDLLAEKGIPSWERQGWPLLVAGPEDEILAVLGIRQADAGRIGPGTRRAIRVSWPAFDKA